MGPISRRTLMAHTGRAAAAALGLPLLSEGAGEAASPKLKIVVAGAHPDDPESSAGGTMALYADQGHEVVALYLTRGEAGISGKSHAEAARIRTAEAEKACAILNARPVFAGQIDGASEVNGEAYLQFGKLLAAEKPDLVFAPWPVDTHRDHRATSLLVYDAWIEMRQRFELYYTEVMSGMQTQSFHPTRLVDITKTESRKRAACYAHASQNPDEFYSVHELMNRFRGAELGVQYAEAFVRHSQDRRGSLPMVP
ncbi:MAG: PIG-L family deacetylase [Acidobacteria bacterium]|nr:MAG: PIG-L family deacetylase [Acidobacteriota bacterium]